MLLFPKKKRKRSKFCIDRSYKSSISRSSIQRSNSHMRVLLFFFFWTFFTRSNETLTTIFISYICRFQKKRNISRKCEKSNSSFESTFATRFFMGTSKSRFHARSSFLWSFYEIDQFLFFDLISRVRARGQPRIHPERETGLIRYK